MSDQITTAAEPARASDMSAHWRLVTAEARNATNRIHGTWWVSRDNVKTVDVTIWDNQARSGRVFYSGDLTAFVTEGGGIDLPKHMISSSKLADAEDAWDLLLEVLNAAANALWLPICPDAPARTEPTEEQVAEAAHRGFCERRDGDLPNTFEKYDELDAERLAWWRSAARAVLALLPQRVAPTGPASAECANTAGEEVRPLDLSAEAASGTTQRVAPSEEGIHATLSGILFNYGDEDPDDLGARLARHILALYASQPTVAEVKAEAWDECVGKIRYLSGSRWTGDDLPNPYREEADRG